MNIEELQDAWKQAVEDGDTRQAESISAKLAEYGLLQLAAVPVHAAVAQDKGSITKIMAALMRDAFALAHSLTREQVQTTAALTGLRQHAAKAEVQVLVRLVRDQQKELEAVKPRVQRPQGKGPEPRVIELLESNEKGVVASTLGNLVKILEHDTRQAERFRLNEMALCLDCDGRILQKVDESETTIWLGEHYGLHTRTEAVAEAIMVAAHRASYHPVRDYLGGLVWDGVERLDGWLAGYCEAAGGSLELLGAYGRCFLISAVARVMQPGCKADCVLVLQGEQGARKSQAVQLLAGAGSWADSHIDTKGKEGYHILVGPWLFEIPEFDKFSGRDAAWLKAFFSAREDRFRKPWGRQPEPSPRQCVFVGTTNIGGFLTDPTGNRRYWVVQVGQVDLVGLEEVRDQLWAEAMARYQRGEQWHLDEAMERERKAQEGEWLAGDAWADVLGDKLRLAGLSQVRPARLLGPEFLNVPIQHQRKAEQDVAAAMRRLGWTRRRKRVGRVRVYFWCK